MAYSAWKDVLQVFLMVTILQLERPLCALSSALLVISIIIIIVIVVVVTTIIFIK